MVFRDNTVINSENWSIIQNVILPLKSTLEGILTTINPSLYIYILIQKHDGITGGLTINEQVLEITPQTPYNKNTQMLFDYITTNAKHIEYCICDNTGELYSFKISFGKDSYKINIIEKTFQYGTIPQQEDMEQIKNHIRKEISKYFI